MGVLTADGRTLKCRGYGKIKLGLERTRVVIVEVLFVDGRLLGFDLFQGTDAIKELGNVHLTESGEARFGNPNRCAAISIDKRDFSVMFDRSTKAWTALWKWASGHSPSELAKRVQGYTVPDHVRDTYEEELSMWQCNVCPLPYPEKELAPPKGFIPSMAVVQEHKQKVRPMLDYRELNGFVEALTAKAEACSQRLRDWRWQGVNVSFMDLRKAYLQIHIDKALWPFQTVIIKVSGFALHDWVSA